MFAAVLYETERLVVRRATLDDVTALLGVFGDERATRYYGPERPLTRAEVEHHVDGYPEGDARLLALPGIVLLKPGLEPIGFGGVGYYAERDHYPDLFFILRPEHWGNGLATELSRAALRDAFARPEIQAVLATAKPVSAASIRVLEKCGFQCVRYIPDWDRNEYRLDRADYLERYGGGAAARPARETAHRSN